MPSGCRGCASGIGSCAGSALRGALTTDHQVHREAACNERLCREHEIRFVVHQLLAPVAPAESTLAPAVGRVVIYAN